MYNNSYKPPSLSPAHPLLFGDPFPPPPHMTGIVGGMSSVDRLSAGLTVMESIV